LRYLYTRYCALIKAKRLHRVTLERLCGKTFVILPGVFHPRLFFTGKFLAESLCSMKFGDCQTVLDMGTGSGVGAIFAADFAERVLAVDINPLAVRCARLNVLLNGVETKVEVRAGDLFGPVDAERFDLIVFNPPYYRGVPQGPLDIALRGGTAHQVLRNFLRSARHYLTDPGRILLVLSSGSDAWETLEQEGVTFSVLRKKSLLFETLLLVEIR